jgi:hypothetical protein
MQKRLPGEARSAVDLESARPVSSLRSVQGWRSNLDPLTTTQFCRAVPGRFESAQDYQQRLMFPNTSTSGMKMAPEVRTSGAISAGSGDRIRTCDLWVMSQPVPVSHGLPGLKRAGHDQPPVPAITVRLTSSRQLRPVSFTNPFTTSGVNCRRPPPQPGSPDPVRGSGRWSRRPSRSGRCPAMRVVPVSGPCSSATDRATASPPPRP